MPDRPVHFFDLDRQQLRSLFENWGQPSYRADQVLDWVYAKRITDPQQMTNIPLTARSLLAERLQFLQGRILQHLTGSDGTQKLLILWPAPSPAESAETPSAPQTSSPLTTECVMIPAEDDQASRRTACLSCQVGCPVGCRFCASGLDGLQTNLRAGQMVEQAWLLAGLPDVPRLSHVVFMGMGEPLTNFDHVVRAVRILTAPWAMGISARRITISTVGLPAQIRRLAELEIPLNLAISLHAPNDEIRRHIIPWAQRVTIRELIDAGRYYFQKTGREITLEYVLLANVNDRPEHARELAALAKSLRSNVNLIRYNEVPGLPFSRPADQDVLRFQQELRRLGVNVHIRASRGRDIAAACGQLRRQNLPPSAVFDHPQEKLRPSPSAGQTSPVIK